jgi:VanZ family protein
MVLAVALLIGWVMAMAPSTGAPARFAYEDKVQHALAFMAYTLVASRCRLGPTGLWALGLLGFGVAIEFGQSFTPDRQPSLADAFADALGIALGLGVLKALNALETRR